MEMSARFQVYAYDARGHGDSDKPPAGYSWDHFVADLKDFLDRLGLRRAIAIGHSMGGATAAYLAATLPEYLSGLVLIEPIIFPASGSGNERWRELAAGAAKRRLVWPSWQEIAQSYGRKPFFANWREDVLNLYAQYGTFHRDDGQVELKCPGEIEAQVYQNGRSLDSWNRLSDIGCPTLVLHGQHTEHHLAQAAQSVVERIPNARLVAIPGAGHLVPMERPQAVAAEILTFFDDGQAGSSEILIKDYVL